MNDSVVQKPVQQEDEDLGIPAEFVREVEDTEEKEAN